MAWIEKKEGSWLQKNGRTEDQRARRSEKEAILTIGQAAEMLGVDRQTIKKYLAFDETDEAPIPFEAWYRLPGGHIRIYKWIILRLQDHKIN